MSLDFKLGAVTNYETLCYISDDAGKRLAMKSKTETLIFATMSVGIGKITDKNSVEFYMRLKTVYGISGYDSDITLADVRAHIGLETNVFGEEARSKWMKRIFENGERDARYRLRQEAQKQEVAA